MTAQKFKILIVDDEPTNIDILVNILKDEYTVMAANNGEKGLKRCFSDNKPDMILLDVMMPVMDGYTVCEKLKENPKTQSIPVIFVTGKSQVEDEKKGLELGAVDYITKPFSPPVIIQRVKNHLAFYNQNLELERLVMEKTNELQDSREQIIIRLGHAAEYKDNETGMHVKRMSQYSYYLAKEAGYPEEWCQLLRMAALMHDIGKIGIPDAILTKPGKLDKDEWEIMMTHAEIGAMILDKPGSALLELAHSVALTHHEKWNGKGYPNGLSGEDIPIEGRIVAVTDVFDALTSKRPYKEAWPVEKAVSLLKEEKGSHFDPEIVDAFIRILDKVLEVKEKFSDEG